jgi:hypothetical protein
LQDGGGRLGHGLKIVLGVNGRVGLVNPDELDQDEEDAQGG